MTTQFLDPVWEDLTSFSSLALAQVGDAVYELMVRTYLCSTGSLTAGQLHNGRVKLVNATAQAQAAAKILPLLTEEEQAVWNRGRNAHPETVPRGCSRRDYQTATALESLWGWLFLRGERDRLQFFFTTILEDADHD